MGRLDKQRREDTRHATRVMLPLGLTAQNQKAEYVGRWPNMLAYEDHGQNKGEASPAPSLTRIQCSWTPGGRKLVGIVLG